MNSADQDQPPIGTGPTPKLGLRVSAATLSKVLFHHPSDNALMLALERTATLRKIAGSEKVEVVAKPFGGSVRLADPGALQALIGDLHYDSRRSREEGDFRIQIRPGDWERVKGFCLECFRARDESVLETRPERELVEEFKDALDIEVAEEQFQIRQLGIVFEEIPGKTTSVRAEGWPTARIYSVFEALVKSPPLIQAILEASARFSDDDLRTLAIEDARSGGKGRANGVLALPLLELVALYEQLPAEARGRPITVPDGSLLSGNVPAVLENLPVPKYEWSRS